MGRGESGGKADEKCLPVDWNIKIINFIFPWGMPPLPKYNKEK